MRWTVKFAVIVLAVIALGAGAGMVLPASHVAVTRATYGSPPDSVWAVLADFDRWAGWYPGLERVERMPDRNGHTVLMTTGDWGEMTTEILEISAPHRLVTEVDGGGFLGRWTWVLEPAGAGTRLTITEQGEIPNPLFRTMMVFHDNSATMIDFHRALGNRLGESVEPERVETGAAEAG